VRPRAAILAFVVLATVPGAAQAHSLVRVEGGQLRYLSADTTSHNTVTITDTGANYRIDDPTVDGGMDPGPCTPLRLDSQGNVNQVDCSKSGITSLRVDIGEQDDTARIDVALPTILLGGPGNDSLQSATANDVVNGEAGNDTIVAGGGNDTIAGGDGDDSIDGGAGDDVLHGGAGTDTIKAGDGNDDLRTRDGIPDNIDCGAGTDVVTADDQDPAGSGCERVDRAVGDANAGQPEQTVVRADRTAPLLKVGGLRVQHVGARRLVLLVASSEAGVLDLSCSVRVAKRRLALMKRQVTVVTDGAGFAVRFALSRKVLSALRRALARGSHPTALLSANAGDRAGNRSGATKRQVRLVR
jgi:Ca2+-binding RTX toxin-like protein